MALNLAMALKLETIGFQSVSRRSLLSLITFSVNLQYQSMLVPTGFRKLS